MGASLNKHGASPWVLDMGIATTASLGFFRRYIHAYTYTQLHVPLCLSENQSAHQSTNHLASYPSICLCIHVPMHASIHPAVHLFMS